MRRLLFFLAGMIFLCNCNREDPSKVVILVSTNTPLTNVKSGDSVLFHIHSSAVDAVVKNVTITGTDRQNGSIVLLDTLLNVEMSEFDYYYVVPEYDDDTITTALTFTAFSQKNGLTSSYTTSLKIENDYGTYILVDYIEKIMYGCGAYGLGFNLESMSSNIWIDSLRDIYDLCNPVDTTWMLSRTWGSNTGIKFVQFNYFNYEEATVQNIRTTFDMALKSDFIFNVQLGDVILIGRDDIALGVIRILYIHNNANMTNNHYVLSIKLIEWIP